MKKTSQKRREKIPDATAVSSFRVAKGKERIEFCVVAIGDLREYSQCAVAQVQCGYGKDVTQEME